MYYQFLRKGSIVIDGVMILDTPYLIPFKMKAWLDLTKRRVKGENIDSKNIRKHKNDVFRMSVLLGGERRYFQQKGRSKRILKNSF